MIAEDQMTGQEQNLAYQSAYAEGYSSRRKGKLRHDNPYGMDQSWSRGGWDTGWIYAGTPNGNPSWYALANNGG